MKNIKKQLKNLNQIKADPAWKAREGSFLLSQIQGTTEKKKVSMFKVFRLNPYRFVVRPAMSLAIIAIIILVGPAGSVSASKNIWQVTTERIQVTFAFKQEQKAQLELKFAEKKIEKLKEIVKNDSKEKNVEIEKVTQGINKNLKAAKKRLKNVKEAASNLEVVLIADIINQTKSINIDLQESSDLLKEDSLEVSEIVGKAALSANDISEGALIIIVEHYNEQDELHKDTAEIIVKVIDKQIQDAQEELGEVKGEEVLDNEENVIEEIDQVIEEVDLDAEIIEAVTPQDALDEAKDLLENEEFDLVIEKINLSKDLLENIEDEFAEIVEVEQLDNIENNSNEENDVPVDNFEEGESDYSIDDLIEN